MELVLSCLINYQPISTSSVNFLLGPALRLFTALSMVAQEAAKKSAAERLVQQQHWRFPCCTWSKIARSTSSPGFSRVIEAAAMFFGSLESLVRSLTLWNIVFRWILRLKSLWLDRLRSACDKSQEHTARADRCRQMYQKVLWVDRKSHEITMLTSKVSRRS